MSIVPSAFTVPEWQGLHWVEVVSVAEWLAGGKPWQLAQVAAAPVQDDRVPEASGAPLWQ
jgi:hypothetical protein